jgi:1-acyl-sn-glycerol-3-phosphate acyltransferase
MTRKKRRHAHAPQSPKAETVPPPSSEPPVVSTDRDASERLVHAEGADVPQLPMRARPRRSSQGESAGVLPARRPEKRPRTQPPPPSDHALAPSDLPSDPNVAARIRELEERLDRMIRTHARERPDDSDTSLSPLTARSGSPSSVPPPPHPEGVFDTARELLSTDFYLRKWGRLGLRSRSEEVDEFGYDPEYERKVLPFFEFLYERYFRVEAHGTHKIPSEGRCLLVANHSGTLPFDGMMLRVAVRREHPQHRGVRWLAEDGIFHFPFLGSFTNRVGAVRACQENAERLLDHGALVAVFPEGMKGIGKLFRERYKLQRFGRGGFVKLCLRTRSPVVPVAIVGGEETNPMLSRIEYLTKAIGVPYLPVTPTFPLLGPLGLFPAPTKWKIYFGDPIDLEDHGAEAADDEILVGRLNERIRSEIQGMLDRALRERRSVWFG